MGDTVMAEHPNVFRLLIPNADGCRLLVLKVGERYKLPEVCPPKTGEVPWIESWNRHTDDLCEAVKRTLSLSGYARNLVWFNPDTQPEYNDVVIIFDLEDLLSIPSGYHWATSDSLPAMDWLPVHSTFDVHSLTTRLHSELFGTGSYEVQVPWRGPRWFRELSFAIQRIHTFNEFKLAPGCLRQVSNMWDYTLLRVEERSLSSRAVVAEVFQEYQETCVFLRACLPGSHEPKLVAKLFEFLGTEFLPRLVHVDENLHLLIHQGSLSLYEGNDLLILRSLAEFQLASVGVVDELRHAGLPILTSSWLASTASTILRHPLLRPASIHLLQLQGFLNEIRDCCTTFSSYGIPNTLVNGCFTMDNMYTSVGPRQGPWMLSWSRAFVGNPFFDYITITENGFDAVTDEEAVNAYFEMWSKYAPKEKLKEACLIARPLVEFIMLFLELQHYDKRNVAEQEETISVCEAILPDILSSVMKFRRITVRPEAQSVEKAVHLIIPSQHENMVLLQCKGEKYTLPQVNITFNGRIGNFEEACWEPHPEAVRNSVLKATGLNLILLESKFVQLRGRSSDCHLVLVMDLIRNETIIDAMYEWVSREDVGSFERKGLTCGAPMSSLLDDVLGRNASERKAECCLRPWRNMGWFYEVSAWVDVVLKQKAMKVNGPVRQIRCGARSNILQYQVSECIQMADSTTPVVVYAKTVESDSVEVPLTQFIASISPCIPTVLDVSVPLNTFLQIDGGSYDTENMDPEVVMTGLADVQRRSIDHLHHLRMLGAEQIDMSWVSSALKTVRIECIGTKFGTKFGSSAKVRELCAATTAVEQLCSELFSYKIPLTLVHGDLHFGNIGCGTRSAACCFYDWGSAFIGIPFCDFSVLCSSVEFSRTQRQLAQRVYFSKWAEYGNFDDLLRVSTLSSVLYWFVNVYNELLSIEQIALRSCEDLRRLEDMISVFLGSIMECQSNSSQTLSSFLALSASPSST